MTPGALLGSTVASPLGPIEVLLDGDGAVVQLRFAEGDYGAFPGARPLAAAGRATGGPIDEVRRQLDEFFAGGRRSFELDLALRGTPFQLAVWRAMLDVPFGETRTYAWIAAAIGRPSAARAVGRASALNRLPVLVPCHRLVGGDGGLHGYAGGLDIKRRLLAHEAGEAIDPRPGGRGSTSLTGRCPVTRAVTGPGHPGRPARVSLLTFPA
jgi:methylated-DNA-[protein]-cysteine S-methyltransferase